MSPEGSQERADAIARLRAHGALGAAHLDAAELKTRLADTTKSLVRSAKATAGYQQERDAALAALAAVRCLCADAQAEGVGMVPCCAVLAVMRPEVTT